ncbi:MAG TPA: alanine racemase [Polyangiaceae bacterium]|nr:alanine racemase [Polyangiaceae bacterium]
MIVKVAPVSPKRALPKATPATALPRVLQPRRAAPADAVRPTRAEINLGHLRHNLKMIKRAAGRSRVFGVLKADAYGHGAPAVARTLERTGIDGFCVALLEEAVELREAGIGVPILVMGGYNGQSWGEVLARGVTPVIYDVAQAEGLAREVRLAEGRSAPAGVHFKIDTGMGRLGCELGEMPKVLERLRDIPEIRIEGLMTHFAGADDETIEPVSVQLERFEQAANTAKMLGIAPEIRHAANSAALFRCREARLDWVRPGIALFGVAPRYGEKVDLRPAMSLRTEIVALRHVKKGDPIGYGWTWRAPRASVIATIPMGYADGLSRHLSNRGAVLVAGKRAPIVGTVSMDLTMIDVTEHPGAAIRDEVMVLGPQHGALGKDVITAAEIAGHVGTIPWDILTSVSRRVPRFYREP